MNDWRFMARRQLGSYWAHLHIRSCIYISLYCETLKWNSNNKEVTLGKKLTLNRSIGLKM